MLQTLPEVGDMRVRKSVVTCFIICWSGISTLLSARVANSEGRLSWERAGVGKALPGSLGKTRTDSQDQAAGQRKQWFGTTKQIWIYEGHFHFETKQGIDELSPYSTHAILSENEQNLNIWRNIRVRLWVGARIGLRVWLNKKVKVGVRLRVRVRV